MLAAPPIHIANWADEADEEDARVAAAKRPLAAVVEEEAAEGGWQRVAPRGKGARK
jgi:hypothetical protein